MLIRTPADWISYISPLATQHPMVACVIHGEMSRLEAGTTSTNQYPLVLIEWPSVRKPRSGGPLKMNGRIFVLSTAPDADYPSEDIILANTYLIAHNLVAAIQSHSQDSDYTFALSGEEMTIDPIFFIGSDQQRGWVIPIEIEIDQSLCKDMPFDPADFFMPQFRWDNRIDTEESYPNAQISFENTSILTVLGDLYGPQDWYWQEEYQQPEAIEFNGNYEENPIVITPIEDGPSVRIIHVWLKSRGVDQSHDIWAYARIDSRYTSGQSVPFIPFYPI